MGAADHHDRAGDRPVLFHIIIVSSSRRPDTDKAGPLIEELLREAGHGVAGRDILPDDQATLSARLRSLIGQGQVQAVLLSGGTGISARDVTYEAVSECLDKELPGFGELFRHLSYAEIGPTAIMSRATCGVAGNTLIFALPGSPAACRLALKSIILPEIRHMAYELGKEEAAALAAEPRLDLRQDPPPTREAQPEPEPVDVPGWRGALSALGFELRSAPPPALPAALADNAAVRNVLNAAGQRALARSPDQPDCGLYGYPDLLRPSSKVLLVGQNEPYGAVLALHRHPRLAGLAAAPGMPDPGSDLDALILRTTGRPWRRTGTLFALEPSCIRLLSEGRIWRWDGRRERDEGPPAAALASLLLHWSSR